MAAAKAGAPKLPRSLDAALEALESSAPFRAALGDELIDSYTKLRRQESAGFAAHVSAWELQTTLDC